MSERAILAIWFGFGVIIQASLLIRGSWKLGWTGVCIGIALLCMIPGKHELAYDAYLHILIALCGFAFSFALVFMKEILPVVSEKVLLCYSLLFWFAFFSYFYRGSDLQNVLVAICLVPTLATMFIAFVKVKLTFFWKLVLYTWFLSIVVSLSLFQFSSQKLAIFTDTVSTHWISPIECVFAGMAAMYLVVNATYIYYLVPIPGKNETFKSRMQDWHEFTNLMTQRFDDDRPQNLITALIFFVLGGGLFLNYLEHWIPPSLLINVVLVIPCVLSLILGTPRSVDASAVEP